MSASQLTKSILYRVFFPPILLWDFAKWGVNKFLGEMVSYIVLPAQDAKLEDYSDSDSYSQSPPGFYNHDDEENNSGRDLDSRLPSDSDDSDDGDKLAANLYTKSDVSHTVYTRLSQEYLKVITHDGASLDTLQITPRSLVNTPDNQKKYIINFVGNASCYEDVIYPMKENARDLNRVVIGFNLRGVKKSTGQAKSKNDLVNDGIAQVQRLLDAGVPSQNITLKGHSLGGALATMVAQHFHQQGQPLYLFNDRSFSSITNFVVGLIRTAGTDTGHRESFGMKLLGWMAKPFIKFGVSLVKWEINADDAYKAIPEAYKEYILARSQKTDRDESADDTVITHYASLHHALKSERRAQKDELEIGISRLENNTNSDDKQRTEKLAALKAKKEHFKARKMHFFLPQYDAHCASLTDLKNRTGQNGEVFFKAFIDRADEHQRGSAPQHTM
ncbi:alpha/beta fold hydrolase [Legionella geestiana]|uniref:alpha/beta fold hydrolase n=1 Tax=Legionella geestiana TaxID=45065 RepID=UPI0016528E20|nr:alpha/beta fold hydrolase [Legionella geestiana]